MISHIHSATIVVSDQDAALDFYVNTLGWKKSIDNMMGPTMRFLSVAPPGGGAELVLADPSWAGEIDAASKNTGISFVAPDIDEMYDTLSQRGVHFKGPVEEMPWGARAVWLSDPDGNEFFVVNHA